MTGSILSQADTALTAAQELLSEGKREDALTQLTTAIGGFEAAGEGYGLIIALKVASETNRELGNLPEALEQVRRAHSLLADLKPDAEQVADFATEVGSVYAQMGELTKSRIWYVQGLHGYESANRQAETAHNLICLAGLDRAEGSEQKAQDLLGAAYDIQSQLGATEQMMHVRNAMAQGLLASGEEDDTALAYLTEALGLAKTLGDADAQGETHQLLALVTAQRGDADTAAEHLAQAAEFFTAAGESEKAEFVGQLLRATQR